ncbi:MAG: DUF6624 domain-containing protein [Pirellulales bacterium]
MVVITAAPFVQAQAADSPSTAAPVRGAALRRELLEMTKADQQVRTEMMQELASAGHPIGAGGDASDPEYVAMMNRAAAKLGAVDGKNRARLQEIVKQHGWPGISLVGKDGAHAAWLLVQHADGDREFQKSCLEQMEALPDGEVQKQAIAYLTDRVLVGEKKPQRFGTQMGDNFQPAPLEDPENVDRRRAEVGLPPLAEYIQASKKAYQQLSTERSESEKTNLQ